MAALRHQRIVLWGKQSVILRSDHSITAAADRIEYAETAAHYAYMDLVNGGQALGLTATDLREGIAAFGVQTRRL